MDSSLPRSHKLWSLVHLHIASGRLQQVAPCCSTKHLRDSREESQLRRVGIGTLSVCDGNWCVAAFVQN